MGYIYKLTNTVNGKAYIGQTIMKLEYRINCHFDPNRRGCRALHNAIQKYGRDAFTLEILHETLDIFLDDLEVAEIKRHNTLVPNGYNLHGGGHANKGVSDETRKKISEAGKGKIRSPETRKKMSDANKGKILSPEHRQKISEAGKRRTHTPETRKKISEAGKRRKWSPETRKKISEANSHPERAAAVETLNALPQDMPLKEKRKLIRHKFTEISHNTVYDWVKKWSELS